MLHIYLNAFKSVLVYIIPLIIIMLAVYFWTKRFSKKKQTEMMEKMQDFQKQKEEELPDKKPQ